MQQTFRTPFALILALALFLAAPLIADDSGGWSNSSGSEAVTVGIKGGIHGDYKVTFTDSGGSRTVKGTPDSGGGAGDVEESEECLIVVRDEDGNETHRRTYRFKNGKVQYKIGNQTTWRRMQQDPKPKPDKLERYGVAYQSNDFGGSFEAREFWMGDDTIGSLPDDETLGGDI